MEEDSRYNPPSDYCGKKNPVSIDFVTPSDKTSNLPNKFSVEIRADSTVSIAQVELEVDGTRVRTFTARPYKHELELDDGIHTLRVKAKDSNGNEADRSITVGVNTSWDLSPTPIPSETLTE